LGFTRGVKNPFIKYVDHFYNTWLVAKSEGKDVIADLCKLMLNSIYGKTVTRDIEDTYIVTTVQQFIRKGDDKHIKDFDILGNG